MKKIVLGGALCAALSVQIFALGGFDSLGGGFGSGSASGSQSTSATRGTLQVSAGAAQTTVYNVGDLPAVPEVTYYPEPNPRAKLATGELYVQPSNGLSTAEAVLPPPVYAISGVKGQRLDAELRRPAPGSTANPYAETVDIFVDVGAGDYFVKDVREGFDATSWIRNLPEGLRARAHSVKAGSGSQRISFYITGTPAAAQRSEITVVIPAGYLSSGREKTFVSATEEKE